MPPGSHSGSKSGTCSTSRRSSSSRSWSGWRTVAAPAGLTAMAVLVPAALLVTVPLESLFTISLLSDSFALIPLLRLTQRLDGGAQDVRVLLGLGLVGAGFSSLRCLGGGRPSSSRRGDRVPARFVGGDLPDRRFHSAAVRATAGPSDRPWIDHAIGTEPRAAFLYTPEIANPHTLWQTEFWNRAVGSIYQVQTDAPGNPAARRRSTCGPDESWWPIRAGRFPPEYAVADADAQVVGDVVAQRRCACAHPCESSAPSRRSHRGRPRRRLDGRRGFVQPLRGERRHPPANDSNHAVTGPMAGPGQARRRSDPRGTDQTRGRRVPPSCGEDGGAHLGDPQRRSRGRSPCRRRRRRSARRCGSRRPSRPASTACPTSPARRPGRFEVVALRRS